MLVKSNRTNVLIFLQEGFKFLAAIANLYCLTIGFHLTPIANNHIGFI